jgi:hypothetical protein
MGLYVELFVILYVGMYVRLYMGLYGGLYVIIWKKLTNLSKSQKFPSNTDHPGWKLYTMKSSGELRDGRRAA